ncbi:MULTISPECIES: hypothetical protein [Galbibacter]|uniref:Uncharacterized protein n=1 Tax=Galbibacter pacificus TaxID=2996052 RepID=A0ABT6FT73_9FLAO|nr:hypothetical protein [Galbibacter pacificus]MDG3582627.1 hypothetical protein [Galbibacter pacificus]MDG3586254.1 hypothetical protein [Galbibacter pacificus]
MKKLIFAFALLFLSGGLWSQTTSVSTSTSKNSYVSISKSETTSEYNFKASFDKENTAKVLQVIEKNLGAAIEKSDRFAYWEGTGYTLQLRQGKVKIEIQKEETTKSFQLKMEDLSEQISEILGHEDAPRPPRPPKTNG